MDHEVAVLISCSVPVPERSGLVFEGGGEIHLAQKELIFFAFDEIRSRFLERYFGIKDGR